MLILILSEYFKFVFELPPNNKHLSSQKQVLRKNLCFSPIFFSVFPDAFENSLFTFESPKDQQNPIFCQKSPTKLKIVDNFAAPIGDDKNFLKKSLTYHRKINTSIHHSVQTL